MTYIPTPWTFDADFVRFDFKEIDIIQISKSCFLAAFFFNSSFSLHWFLFPAPFFQRSIVVHNFILDSSMQNRRMVIRFFSQ